MAGFSSLLLVLSLFQFLLIFALLYKVRMMVDEQKAAILNRESEQADRSVTLTPPAPQAVVKTNSNTVVSSSLSSTCSSPVCDWNGMKEFKGVAVTLLLHAPSWFQRRYTMMIQNTHNNIPDDWIIQVFYTGDGQSKAGLDMNHGIQRLIDNGRVRLTVIPKAILTVKKKKFELMTERWIWENMLAEKVFLFGGTSVICSNSHQKITDFLSYDYIGAPWGAFKGIGGDGGISLRSKSLMLSIIDYELSKAKTEEAKKTSYKSWGQEDIFFLSRYQEMLKNKHPAVVDRKIKIATKNDTLLFAANGGVFRNDVFVVQGTMPELEFKIRDKFMTLCPEMKMFYPSLHDPHCFGASPESEQCAASICALRPKDQRRGGC